jgi:hypothetical protein
LARINRFDTVVGDLHDTTELFEQHARNQLVCLHIFRNERPRLSALLNG